MKNILWIMVLFFLVGLTQNSNAEEWSANANVFLGAKLLDEDDWGQFDDQFELGASADFKGKNWPVSLTAVLSYSGDSDSDYDDTWNDDRYRYTNYVEDAYTFEFNLGVKKIWEFVPSWKVSFAAGGTIIYGAVETTWEDNLDGYSKHTEKEGDVGFGYWGAVASYKTIFRHLNVGIDVRYSNAEIELYHKDREAGGVHVGVMVGYCWGGQ